MRPSSFFARPALLWFAVILLASAAGLYAQEVSAGITGTISDPTAAAIAGANVTAKDLDRGTVWTTSTNSEGIYAFPRIPPGNYEIRVAAAGFHTIVRRGVALELNARARLDMAMELGAVTESVEVSASAALLQTESTQIGAVISGSTNVNLPLNGRNFVQLTLMTAGSTTVNPAGFVSGLRTTAGGRPYINGNREEANNFLLDGIDNNNANSNMVTYQPSVDAIQEFKIITSNAPAEFGNFQGGIINITMKSGTNKLHGSLFEFLRNDKLNANNWARNWQGTGRAAIRHNVFGGTAGGPILKDKLFFFADYQGIRRANPGAPGSVTVVPVEFRRGDFSRLLTERATQLYDPLTTDASGLRQPFANNQIPVARFDPVARNLFSMTDVYPLPMNTALRFNALNTSSSYVKSDQGDFKVDAKLTNRDDFSGRYSNGRQDNPGTNTIPALLNTFFTSPFEAGVLNWTHTFSPTVVNEARAGLNRSVFSDGGDPGDVGNLAEKLGIAQGNERGPGLMQLNFVGGLSNSLGSQNNGPLRYNVNNTYHFVDNLTLIRGRHLLKTGGQFMRIQANVFFSGNGGRTGYMRYTGQYTAGPNANTSTSKGLAEVDFALGYPTSLGRGVATGLWGQRASVVAGYFQDDYRVNRSLTLNLGIRWEYHSPYTEVADRQSNFEFYTGRLLQAGKDGVPHALYSKYLKDWQPRVGFAWTPGCLGRKTVVRGAYTIASYLEGMGVGERLPLNPPFATQYAAIYDGFPTVRSTSSQGLSVLQAVDPFKSASVKMWDPKFRPAEVQQWSFVLERQLPMDMLFSAGYVGQHGSHLAGKFNYLQKILLPDGKTQASPYLAGNPVLAQLAAASGTTAYYNQRYDGLQTSLRKRFSRGLEYGVSYTYSKGISDSPGYYGEAGQAAAQSNAGPQNVYNRLAEWGPTYFDATHMLSVNVAYELPFGRGKAIGSQWNGVMDKICGNWRLSGISALRTGFPLTITAIDRSGTLSTAPRANRIGDGAGKQGVGQGSPWLDTTAFRQPVAGTFGSSGVGVVRGPGLRHLDLSLQKQIPVSESKHFEFRIESFNTTNTPIFNAPSVDVNAAVFGEISSAQGDRNIQLGLKFYF